MRIMETDGARRLAQVQLYLTVEKAQELVRELTELLREPEANRHFHVSARDGEAEVSVSIVTPTKMAKGGYTSDEVKSFGDWKPIP